MQNRSARPSPTLLSRTLVLALALGLVAGLALGTVGSAEAGALTSRTVKKIATHVVKKQARHLSVANASALDGRPAAAYLDRVVAASASNQITVANSDANAVLGPVSITVPAGVGWLRIDGHLTVAGGSGGFGIQVYYALDTGCRGAAFPEYQQGQSARFGNADVGSVGFSALHAVTAGSHSVLLCADSSNNPSSAYNRDLVVETVALGGS